MAKHGTMSLRRVLLDDELYPVAEFGQRRDLLLRRREARCPMCREPVTLVVDHPTPHVRHLKTSKCPSVTKPETALHYNLKHHLRDQLLAQAGPKATLWAQAPCAGRQDFAPSTGLTPRRCPSKAMVTFAWVKGWETVAVEEPLHQLGLSRTPDVVLLQAGIVVGGVEVRYSSKVSAEKASDLAVMGVPWVEVEAREDLLDGDSAWSARQPLPVLKVRPEHGQSCRACAQATARAHQSQHLFAQVETCRRERDIWQDRGEHLTGLKRQLDSLERQEMRWLNALYETVQDMYANPDQAFNALLDDVQKALETVQEEPERFGTLKLTRKYLFFSSDQPARALLPECAELLGALLVTQWDQHEVLNTHDLAHESDLLDRLKAHETEGESLKRREQRARQAYMELVTARS